MIEVETVNKEARAIHVLPNKEKPPGSQPGGGQPVQRTTLGMTTIIIVQNPPIVKTLFFQSPPLGPSHGLCLRPEGAQPLAR